jgi:hypothetical protein
MKNSPSPARMDIAASRMIASFDQPDTGLPPRALLIELFKLREDVRG